MSALFATPIARIELIDSRPASKAWDPGEFKKVYLEVSARRNSRQWIRDKAAEIRQPSRRFVLGMSMWLAGMAVQVLDLIGAMR